MLAIFRNILYSCSNRTRLKDDWYSGGVFWTGLHAPDPTAPHSYFWEDCTVQNLIGPEYSALTENHYQCIAIYSRDYSDLEFQRVMCNQTNAFICYTSLNGEEDIYLSLHLYLQEIIISNILI